MRLEFDGFPMSDFVRGLKCRLCGKTYPKQALNFCTEDFGPLEVDYDYDAIREAVSRGKIELRPFNMWRYRELLPIDGEPTVGPLVGGTPLIRADRLAEAWASRNSVDQERRRQLPDAVVQGSRRLGGPEQGPRVRLHDGGLRLDRQPGQQRRRQRRRRRAGELHLRPADLEPAKILGTSVYGAKVIGVTGTYDEVNRLCTQVAFKYGWGFVNINLRPFYAEGSKTMGYEIAEQLGWRTPQHVVVPDGRAAA